MLTHAAQTPESALSSLQKRAGHRITHAVSDASRRTGVDFAYLMNSAAVESSFNPDAKAQTSSARGMYQFIESTWLETMRDHGAKHGLDRFANAIDDNGRVHSRALRREILDLRNDPHVSSLMAGELTAANQNRLEQNLGPTRPIGATDLYMAHFLGAGGASQFIRAMDNNPLRPAADLFPREARSNPSVFYDRSTGKALSLAAVYDRFDQKFDGDTSVASADRSRESDRTAGAVPSFSDAQRERILALRGHNTINAHDIVWNGPRLPIDPMIASLRPARKPDLGSVNDLAAFEHQERVASAQLLVLTQLQRA